MPRPRRGSTACALVCATALFLPGVARAAVSVKLEPAASPSVAQGRTFSFTASLSSDVAPTDEGTFTVMPVGQASKAEAVKLNVRPRSEEHTSELQSRSDLVCRLL